jgi:hypothetical protein
LSAESVASSTINLQQNEMEQKMNDNTAKKDAIAIEQMSRQFGETPTYSEALAQTNPRWELHQLLTIAHMNRQDLEMTEVAERVERAAIADLRSTIFTEDVLKSPAVLRLVEIMEANEDDE